MRYLGGKHKYGKEIAAVIRSQRKYGQPFREPFCGALNVTQHIYPGPRYASDSNPWLIACLQAVQDGWIPPDHVDEGEYDELNQRHQDGEISPLIGFSGFACSFGGKWFGGYARGADRNFCYESKVALLSKMYSCKDVIFECKDFKELKPEGEIIYCDPPYEGTTSYKDRPTDFWKIIRQWSLSNTVIISEYKAPPDFKLLWSDEKHLSVRRSSDSHVVEKLFKCVLSPSAI